MENPVIIIGIGNIGKSALGICNENGIEVFGFLTDSEDGNSPHEIDVVPVLREASDEKYLDMLSSKCEYFIASEVGKFKRNMSSKIIENYKKQAVNLIHNDSSISDLASIGHGNLIDAQSVVKPFVEIGNLCNIFPGTVIDCSSLIGDFVQIGANTVLGAEVTIEDNVFIGNGVTIVAGVTVGEGASVGAGSVVVGDVKPNSQVFGNPAKEIG